MSSSPTVGHETFPDVCPEDAVSCDCSWHENARYARAHNAALDEQDRQAKTAKERAEQKRARRASRCPGFSAVRPPRPTHASSHRKTAYSVVYQPAEKVTENPDLMPTIRGKTRRVHTRERRDNPAMARRVQRGKGAR